MRSFLPRLPHCIFPLLLCCLGVSFPALADVTLGGNARAVAMGGAGLASGDSADATTLNPAFLADTGLRFNIQMPNIDARTDGIGYGDVMKLLGSAKLSPADAIELVGDVTSGPKQLDARVGTGLLLPQLDLRGDAMMHVETVPNAGDNTTDVYAGGITNLPGIGFGFHLPISEDRGRLSVGVRVRSAQAYYSHYIVGMDPETEKLTAKPADAEMGGKNYLHTNSISADLGVNYKPASMPELNLAFVVNNAIEPKAIDFGGAPSPGYLQNGGQLAPRTFSVGAAIVGEGATLAADLVDITGAQKSVSGNGKPQLRLGVELRSGLGLALRGGYNTHSGLTAGLGIGGFGVAYSRNTPVMLSQSITF